MAVHDIESLDFRMASCWQNILSKPVAKEIRSILASGDRKLYSLWLCQVAHLTKHTSAHQALVGVRSSEISHAYAKFCFEHASEEVGHEMMAVHDLRKIGFQVHAVKDLPEPLSSTTKLNAYLFYVSQHAHPATRLGFSYWAEKCYPFIHDLASSSKKALGLENHQMTFFVSHAEIDEKHAEDVEKIVVQVCKTSQDWAAVETGMVDTLEMAVDIFEEIHSLVSNLDSNETYKKFLSAI